MTEWPVGSTERLENDKGLRCGRAKARRAVGPTGYSFSMLTLHHLQDAKAATAANESFLQVAERGLLVLKSIMPCVEPEFSSECWVR